MAKKIRQLQNFIFFALLAVLPFNVRHIFNYEAIKNLEGFREHLSLSLYAFDILLFALIALQALIFLGNFSLFGERSFFKENFSSRKTILSWCAEILKSPCFYFVVFLFAGIPFSIYPGISLYNALRLFAVLIFFTISSRVILRSKIARQQAVLAVFWGGTLQSLIAIAQFFLQRSLGLRLLGESVISPGILGVSKFEFDGTKFIRAYGTFPHPNILGAFLLLALACGFWLVFHENKKQKLIGITGISGGITVIFAGIFLSYSRSIIALTAVFVLTIAIANKKWFTKKYLALCKKIFISKVFQGAIGIVFVFALLFGIYNLLLPRMCLNSCPGDNSIPLRTIYNKKAFSVISKNPFWGVGPGSFVEYTKENLPAKKLQDWEFQPAHNLFLAISSEIGLPGLAFFLLIIFHEARRKRHWLAFVQNPLLLVFALLLLAGMTDHYFWTIPQGQYIFWLSLAFFSRSGRIDL